MGTTSAAAADPRAAPLSIASVGLVVRDIDRVARFYRDAIGLEPVFDEPGRVALGVGGTALLSLRHRADALPDDPATAGLFHTAFLLPGRAELGRWLAHASASGIRLDGAADHLVSEAVYLHDPEGNGIEVYADRPRASWRWTGEGSERRVTMANARLDTEGLLALADRTAGTGAPAGTTIGHVHLRVGDVARAAGFYRDRVGLDVTAQWDSAVFLSAGGYHHHIACNSWQSAGAGPRDPNRAGLDYVAFAGLEPHGGNDAGLRDPWGTRLQFPNHNPNQETGR